MDAMTRLLEDIKKSWGVFQEVATAAKKEEVAAFENAIKKMDEAEVPVVRERVMKMYG
jgi:hypothetical protein